MSSPASLAAVLICYLLQRGGQKDTQRKKQNIKQVVFFFLQESFFRVPPTLTSSDTHSLFLCAQVQQSPCVYFLSNSECVCMCVCVRTLFFFFFIFFSPHPMRNYLCSLVGAKQSSMGLLTFQYFSLTSSKEKEPFRTCVRKQTRGGGVVTAPSRTTVYISPHSL